MQSPARGVLLSYLQKGLLFGVVVAIALVIVGRLLVPATSFHSTASALAILLAYGGLAFFWPGWLHSRDPDALRGVVVFGLLAGGVFASEITLEYLFLPADNSRYGMVEFGAVFGLYILAAFVSALRSRSLTNAVLTSVACAYIASLVWVISVLVVFYSFRGSSRQVQVFRAEGNYQDFARSGMSDFNAFIMEDFMGAAFFHLSLGLIAAALLGVFGGLLGKAFARKLRVDRIVDS